MIFQKKTPMSPDNKSRPLDPAPEEEILSSPKQVEKARDIFQTFANTVSAMKIFPAEHATVKTFVDELSQKMIAYLDMYQKLEIGIAEYTFTFMGKPIYRDELTIKSLPFVFFKDGMQMLFFYQGLDTDEIFDFLDLIKRESQKPPDESDIVTALWEKDLANIQYYAPDDYIETKILEERGQTEGRPDMPVLPAEFAREIIEIKVDTSKFSTGKISLAPEDRKEIQMAPSPEAKEEQEDAIEEDERGFEKSPAGVMDPTLTENELGTLESMIRTNRTISPEEEFIDLMIEILNLEEDIKQGSASLDVLTDYHLSQVQKGNFHISIMMVHKIQELREFLSQRQPEKAALLETFLRKTVSEKTLGAMRELLEKKQPLDFDSLFDFLKLLGSQAFSLVADLYETIPPSEFRTKILAYLKDLGEKDYGTLASLADDSRPNVSKEIIAILSRSPDKKAVQYLAIFLSLQNKEIKLEAIHALGQIKDEMANKILMGFLGDGDEELRIQAALKLDYYEDKARLAQMIQNASSKSFGKKGYQEKEAIFNFLGRTRTQEAFVFLEKTLQKASWFPKSARNELRLCAVAGLESMATPQAMSLLQKGASFRAKKIREACLKALENMSTRVSHDFERQS